MAKESIKNQIEPVSAENVGETIANAITTHTDSGVVEQSQTAIIQEQEKVTPLTDIDQKIYIGPNLLSMTTYTVIGGAFPLHIEDLIKKCPAIEKLCVPITDFVESEKRAKTKGTLEHKQYKKILEFMQGKGE